MQFTVYDCYTLSERNGVQQGAVGTNFTDLFFRIHRTHPKFNNEKM